MKCQGCNTAIGQQFTHAIVNNQCPACGKSIMESTKLASYLNLQELLKRNFSDLDVEKISTLIVANFEIKQLFKEQLTEDSEEGIIEEEDVKIAEEIVDPKVAYDEEYKKHQKQESKEILKRMREEALSEATADHWGLGEANGLIGEEGITHEATSKIQQMQSADNVVTGARGSFTRGS